MGRRTAKDTAALIEEVARGERLLEEIKDPELRETVRLALRLHKDPYSGPDAKTRSRIRSRVFRTLRPGPASLADRIAITFEILAKPTPYAMRAFAIALVVVCVGASTALVSAGTVADDPLYSVKIASEQVRLALAATPEDRAIVELSIAEHRLAEAATLATGGYDDDVIVATSEYGEHLANAAAELAQVESITPETATLVTQLQQKIDEHRATAAAVSARLADDPTTAPAAAALAVLATTNVPSQDLSPAAAIAEQAADAADRAATVAEQKVTPRSSAAPRATPTPQRTVATQATVAARTQAPRATETRRAESARESNTKNERAAESARKAADEAKAAAQKAKQGSKKTPSPTPHRR
ncbi:MAG: hypothetical protein E6J09_11215 [Chloroflexi bacterium]|nr:MAG: hypothetical protein E6J09_11215 [Chloroflexota bacterium]